MFIIFYWRVFNVYHFFFFFFSSRRRHTRYWRDWSSDVCSSDLRATGRRPSPPPSAAGSAAPRPAGRPAGGARRRDRRGRKSSRHHSPRTAKRVAGRVRSLRVGRPGRTGDCPHGGRAVNTTVTVGLAVGALVVLVAAVALRLADRLGLPSLLLYLALGLALGESGLGVEFEDAQLTQTDRKSTRLNSSHANISYAVF